MRPGERQEGVGGEAGDRSARPRPTWCPRGAGCAAWRARVRGRSDAAKAARVLARGARSRGGRDPASDARRGYGDLGDPNHADVLEGARGAHIAPVAPRSGGRRSPAARGHRSLLASAGACRAPPLRRRRPRPRGAPPSRRPTGRRSPITGHGFGHGEGMGQWGAYGYATVYEWPWQQILAHYYGGTTLGATDPDQPISVRLQALDDRPFTAFVQEKGLMATTADGGGRPVPLAGRPSRRDPGRATRCRAAPTGRCAPTRGAVRPHRAGCRSSAAHAPSSAATNQYLDVFVPGVDPATPDATNLIGVCQPDNSVIYYRGTPAAGERHRRREPHRATSWASTSTCAAWCRERCRRRGARRRADSARTPCGSRPWPPGRSPLAGGNRWAYAKICDTQTCQVYGGAAKRAAVGAALAAARAADLARRRSPRRPASCSSGAARSCRPCTRRRRAASPRASCSRPSSTTATSCRRTTPGRRRRAGGHHPGEVAGHRLAADDRRHAGATGWASGAGACTPMTLRGTSGSMSITGDQFRIGLGLKSNWFFVPDGCTGPHGRHAGAGARAGRLPGA